MWNGKIEDIIIYEDKEIIVCHKPAGIAVQNARIGAMDLESGLKNYLALKARKEQASQVPYLAVIHRLDQPVEGVVVFGKTPAAAKALSAQMAQGQMGKFYLAVTFGEPKASEGTLEDCLKKDGRTNTSAVVAKGTQGGKNAKLHYKVLQSAVDEGTGREKHLLQIHLETGRHHQIRVQMAHAGMGLAGDRKYNSKEVTNLPLGLCSCSLEFVHPKTKKKMKFETTPKGGAFAGFEIV